MEQNDNLVNALLSKANDASSIFVRFEQKVAKYGMNYVYCFVEDYDMAYYSNRIENILNIKCDSIRCKGKKNLIKVHDYLKDIPIYNKYFKRFFIDADFDNNKGIDNDIYVTPCYSIENLYLTDSCVQGILKTEYDIDEIENKDKFTLCMNLWHKRLSEFHNTVNEFNAWYATLHDMEDWNSKIHLNDNFPKDFIHYKMDTGIIKGYALSDIENKYPNAPRICEEIFIRKKQWIAEDPLKRGRGKYEIEFLFHYLKYLNEDAHGRQIYTIKKASPMIALKKMISLFSQYADTPESLKYYIREGKIKESSHL